MSFTYQANVWIPHSTSEHAAQMLSDINAILSAQGVTVGGQLVQLRASYANVVWLILLAVGAMRAALDQILLLASKMFDVSQATDAQIEACLPLAGTHLLDGASSVVTIHVVATADGQAVIPDGAKVPYGAVCNFVVPNGSGVTIPAGSYADIFCVSDVVGPITVSAGALTAFQTTYENVASVSNPLAAIPGRNTETVQEVRQRLVRGNISDLNIDGVARAIKEIPGIADCKVWFNPDPTNPLTLPGGATLAVRTAYIIVQGQDPTGNSIATSFAQRMLTPTKGASSQPYVSLAGQQVLIHYDSAAAQRLYAKVKYDSAQPVTAGFDQNIRNMVAASRWLIGEEVTAQLMASLFDDFAYATVTDVQLSTDNFTWVNYISVAAASYASFSSGDVTVVADT